MPFELVVGLAVGAAAASPTVRKAVRKGMIYGLGGVLVAYDKMAAMAHEAAQGARRGVAAAAAANEPATPAAAESGPHQETASQPTAATPSP
jgi:hypothetical protein